MFGNKKRPSEMEEQQGSKGGQAGSGQTETEDTEVTDQEGFQEILEEDRTITEKEDTQSALA